LAEYRVAYPGKMLEKQGSAMLVDGVRQWVEFDIVAVDADDFEPLGAAYEADYPAAVQFGAVGNATTRLFKQRSIVDYAMTWLPKNREK
jgi:aminoglycoside 3-N-acetyltransferase